MNYKKCTPAINRQQLLFGTILLSMIFTVSQANAAQFLNKEIEIKGKWQNGVIHAHKIETPNVRRDKDVARLTGRIDRIDRGTQRFTIGPLQIYWSEATRFDDIAALDLKPGVTIRIKLKRDAQGRLLAKSINRRDPMRYDIRLRGVANSEKKLANRSYRVTILGIPVQVSREVSKEVKSLIRRPDDRRPSDQLSFTINDRALVIGGEYNLEGDYRGDYALGTKDNDPLNPDSGDDIARVNQELELEFFYPFTDDVSLFLETKLSYRKDVYNEDDTEDKKTEKATKRGESWVFINRLFDDYSSLQLGRQNFREKREWWWDEDLDGVRLRHSQKNLHAEIGFARELAKSASDQDDIPGEQEDVSRLLLHGAWQWNKRQLLEAFALSQRDTSDVHTVGTVTRLERDESDADLTWAGLRARGKIKFKRSGRLLYWLDTAVVRGTEDVYEYDFQTEDEYKLVGSTLDQDVEAWAVDLGASWSTRLPGKPAFTLGYAMGTGDEDTTDNKNENFRQTGLHDNNGRFHGVNRFRYYGEVLRPELSNLHIATAAIGFPFWRKSSVELVYHRYTQDYAFGELRDTRLEVDPNGTDKDIGQEWDLIIGMRKWKHVDLEIIAGQFIAGEAYGANEDDTAYTVNMEFTYNF